MSGPSEAHEVARLLALSARLMPYPHAMKKLVETMNGMDALDLAAGVTQTDLARMAGISDRSVRTALRQLEALGAVERIQQARRVFGYRLDADRVAIILEALR